MKYSDYTFILNIFGRIAFNAYNILLQLLFIELFLETKTPIFIFSLLTRQ